MIKQDDGTPTDEEHLDETQRLLDPGVRAGCRRKRTACRQDRDCRHERGSHGGWRVEPYNLFR